MLRIIHLEADFLTSATTIHSSPIIHPTPKNFTTANAELFSIFTRSPLPSSNENFFGWVQSSTEPSQTLLSVLFNVTPKPELLITQFCDAHLSPLWKYICDVTSMQITKSDYNSSAVCASSSFPLPHRSKLQTRRVDYANHSRRESAKKL